MSTFCVLKKRKDFLRAAKDITIVSKNVIMQAARPLSVSQEMPARIGFTATKKLGKAYIRNRTKRRLRAVVRDVYNTLALPNVDYVLIGRFGTYSCAYEDLQRDVKWAFKKVNQQIMQRNSDDPENSAFTD